MNSTFLPSNLNELYFPHLPSQMNSTFSTLRSNKLYFSTTALPSVYAHWSVIGTSRVYGPYILHILTLTVYRLAGGGLSYGAARNGLTYPHSPELAGICRLLNILSNTLSPGNELYFFYLPAK